jgi:uncharacterized membrane protein
MTNYRKEAFMWSCILLPYFYLAFTWQVLPDRVPSHFGLNGTADDWSRKEYLLLVPCTMNIAVYLLMLLIPILDPKKKIKEMGEKYTSLRMVSLAIVAIFSVYFLYCIKGGSPMGFNVVMASLGVGWAVLGNYFQAVRPNYFIGIKTPWTLENENVWKATHRLAGKLWMAGGLSVAVLAMMLTNQMALVISIASIVMLMSFIPAVYSFVMFKREIRSSNS